MKSLIVIGITGSVGKTSTKEFLAKIVEAKYKVAKTPESINTQIGIAKYILNELKDDTEIFIVEMGAYKKGEIKEICNMVNPKIGMITYIGNQHLELFGSLQNLIDAKYELIKSLPEDGIAVFNEENRYCKSLAQITENSGKKTLLYGLNVKNIHISKESIEFTYIIGKKQVTCLAKVFGKQTITNLLGAIVVADKLGITDSDIKMQVSKISPPSHTMELAGKYKDVSLIDDTFNTSKESVSAALEYMRVYKGRKILVLSPLIELGKEGERINQEVLTKAEQTCDLVFLTNKNSPNNFKEKIENLFENDSVIVFEGKEAKKYLNVLL